jgi:hypothetical protein
MIFKKKVKKRFLPELQKRSDLARSFAYIAQLIAGNTAIVPDGKKEAEKYKTLSTLITEANNEYIAQVLLLSGFPADRSYEVKNDGTVVAIETPTSQ